MATDQDFFQFSIENQQEFAKALDRLGKKTSDFRIPFKLIASDFYRSQRIIFNLKSEGLYPPLGGFKPNSPSGLFGYTRRQAAEFRKQRATGHDWFPILYGKTGDLRDSTLSKNHRYSVFFLGRQELQIGTSVPYGEFHQSDEAREKLPQRKFIFIDGGPKDASRASGLTGRSDRWQIIVNDYIRQITTGRI